MAVSLAVGKCASATCLPDSLFGWHNSMVLLDRFSWPMPSIASPGDPVASWKGGTCTPCFSGAVSLCQISLLELWACPVAYM